MIDGDELLLHDWDSCGVQGPGSNFQMDCLAEQASVQSEAPLDPDLQAILMEMHALALEDEGVRELLQISNASSLLKAAPEREVSTSTTVGAVEKIAYLEHEEAAEGSSSLTAAIDEAYFDSYAFFDIHHAMLADRERSEAYRRALECNPTLLKESIVLDVGCGTGVLSMFAARAGASRVFAVDGSPDIAAVARKICAANGYGGDEDGAITVISSKIEALEALSMIRRRKEKESEDSDPADGTTTKGKVDVIVSEWMGYALLFESMLDSVITARDKFLRPGGALLPDIARIHIAAAGIGASGLDFWNNVYGFDMRVAGQSLRKKALKEALVRVVEPRHLISESIQLVSLDLVTMERSDQDFTSEFELRASAGPQECHALVLWFDVAFTDRFCSQAPQELHTGPYAPATHWAQTVLVLPTPVTMAPAAVNAPGAAAALRGRLSMSRSVGRHRMLDISVEYAPLWSDGTLGEGHIQLYAMGVSSKS